MKIRVSMSAVALLVAACGGSGSGATFSEVSLDPGVDAASTALVDRWGDEDAFYVVVTALDLGYSIEQLLAADGDIEADGTIDGVDPAGPPLGMLSLTGPDGEGPPEAAAIVVAAGAASLAYGSAGPSIQYVGAVASWMNEIYEVGEDVIAKSDNSQPELTMTDVVLGLAAQGYSLDQIVESVVFGEFVPVTSGSTTCFAVVDPSAGFAMPAGEPIPTLAPDCAIVSEGGPDSAVNGGSSTTTTVVAGGEDEGGEVRVYRGTATFQLTAYQPQNRPGTNFCETSGPAEMVVRPDGTLTFSVTWTEWVYQVHQGTGCLPYTEIHSSAGDSFTSVKEGIWSDSEFGTAVADPIHAINSSSAQFDGEFVGDTAVTIASLSFEGVGVRYVEVGMALEMSLVDG